MGNDVVGRATIEELRQFLAGDRPLGGAAGVLLLDADGKAPADALDAAVIAGLVEGLIDPSAQVSGGIAVSPALYRDVTIATAAVKALNAAPAALVPAPGAGHALILVGALLFLDFATTAYDGIAAGEDLSIKYTDGSGVEVAQIEATGFLDAGADARRFVNPLAAAAFAPAADAALVLHMLTGEIATGDSPLKVRTFYRIVPATL